MPSKTPKQARLMAAAAHSPKFAKKVGVPMSVAKDFNQADAGTGILKSRGRGGRLPAKKGRK
jgi:hypothetical protein